MKLADVKTFDQLLPWLAGNLDWPIDEIEIAPDTAFDDLTYEYEGKELGLKQEDIAHVREIRQLRPLVTNQPWGIFFVNFEDKKIPVGVLKRILGGLTIRKRQSANKAEQKAWTLHDLLFISSFGKSGERELSFLHFAEENGGKNKTVLKELGWDQQDTQLKLDFVERTLKSTLVWPEDTSDADAWREQWSSAFTSTHGSTIRTARELTRQLAVLASAIRNAAGEVLEFENKNGPLTKIFENFKKTIFHNLTPADFADMYAQTICYGLLAKQIERARNGLDTRTLSADDATLTQGVMQPFLKDLMETFLAIGGRKSSIDFNELGVNEVVELLQAANMTAVLLDFGNRNPHEDPVLHFYEHFLRDYDSIMREQRGVYYTPLPVVRFIVRSAHEILQKEFGLPDGLADTTTWREMVGKNPELPIPKGVSPDAPFVQILDPATGTGTFLVEIIEQIETHLKDKWRKQGGKESEVLSRWNEYVPLHLLPRINGFELMMAPYAIAHIKLGMKLQASGYKPKPDSTSRVRVFLTNTLDRPAGFDGQTKMDFVAVSLAEEAAGADALKSKAPITVIVGNPPYSLLSSNLQPEHRELVEKYKFIGDARIREKNALQFEKNLNDDYVKFFAWCQNLIFFSHTGILGLVSNHSYLDNPTLRGMRHNLSGTFEEIFIVDLHGNATKNETPPPGHVDANVFNIRQGVAIMLASKAPKGRPANYSFTEMWGSRSDKNKRLMQSSYSVLASTKLGLDPDQFYFIPKRSDASYGAWPKLTDAFPIHGAGWISARDNLVVDHDRDILANRIASFKAAVGLKADVLQKFEISDKKGWSYEKAKAALSKIDISSAIVECFYRPFDIRQIFFDSSLVWGCSWPTMRHVYKRENLCLLSTRITKDKWQVLVCDRVPSHKAMSAYDSNIVFPLYAYDNVVGTVQKSANLSPELRGIFARIVESERSQPEAIFDYIYATMNSPTYAGLYADDLKADFPRLPLPGSSELFNDLAVLGKKLVSLHLLDAGQAPELQSPDTRFVSSSEPRVEPGYPDYENGKVMINASCWFEDVTTEVWNFHIGGYQVCEKWLKDRAGKGGKSPSPGRVLSVDDILHYRRITVALRETIRLMGEIDQVIDRHGGWPHAFGHSLLHATTPSR
ncbi:type ISP restriction/modification enzyme [Mesorhizobium sp. B2-1-5]|uniref:type ISP restriction/modification enzyme n=1 Tax=Mesorhizobium sp. B2-1-5 TaxID=2589969 RepID=UPI001126D666|nr:type ISP restriction/modification enzyme [Mesorhizobium sp. B2-1-5]TPM94232.1 hypothetical protein FJ966_18370 [Mesorhizobium sp. B2-1-5]